MSDSPSSSSGASSSSSSDSEDSPANRATRVPRGGPDGGPPRVLSEMDDAQLQEKMQRAQERLQGLDRHVEELRQRSEEHDARSRGKLPPEQTAEYLAKMKQLERKRQDLLKVEMDRAEEMRRRRAERGLPPIPVDTSAAGRAAMAERLEAEAKAGQARLDAYKRSKDWAQAETAHEARLKREREARARARRWRAAARTTRPPPRVAAATIPRTRIPSAAAPTTRVAATAAATDRPAETTAATPREAAAANAAKEPTEGSATRPTASPGTRRRRGTARGRRRTRCSLRGRTSPARPTIPGIIPGDTPGCTLPGGTTPTPPG